MLRIAIVVLMLLASPSVMKAGEEQTGFLVRSLKCDFPVFASQPMGEWGIEPKTGKQDFSFHIDGIKLQSGKARLIGNAGSAGLTVITGDGVVNFIERIPSGNLNLTTIYTDPVKKDIFRAVHSRHIRLLGNPGPSQQYGLCQRWE